MTRRTAAAALMAAFSMCAQTPVPAAQKPAAAAAQAPKLTGFPFQDETLHYSIKWPSGLSLGEVTFSAHRTESGWSFENAVDAGVPGFSIADRYRSQTTLELCSTELERDMTHTGRKVREKTTFDQRNRTGKRVTVFPEGGGKTDFDLPSCARDALAFLYFAREELGQGRVAPADKAFFGSAYQVQLRYTGEATVRLEDKAAVTDRLVISIKGPKSDVSVEAYFARDPARTPLLVKLPLSMGTFSMELVR
jgi:hypothetical protein